MMAHGNVIIRFKVLGLKTSIYLMSHLIKKAHIDCVCTVKKQTNKKNLNLEST